MPCDLLVDALPIACALFLIRFVSAEATYQRAKRTARGLRCPAGIGLRITFRVGGPLLLFAAYKVIRQATSRTDWFLACLGAIFGLSCLLGEPGQITVTPNGVVQTCMLGMKSRQIAWDGAAARYTPGLGEVLLIGGDGTTITHSQYHVGQDEFIHELKQHGVYVQS